MVSSVSAKVLFTLYSKNPWKSIVLQPKSLRCYGIYGMYGMITIILKDTYMFKIAIIEDDKPIQHLYKTKLEIDGFGVVTADNGKEGLTMLEYEMPDLILLDLKMPEMSGDEMLACLRESEWGAGMRVVILTNISRDEAPSALRFLSVDRYIVKAHHTPKQIVDVVHEVLNIKKQRA